MQWLLTVAIVHVLTSGVVVAASLSRTCRHREKVSVSSIFMKLLYIARTCCCVRGYHCLSVQLLEPLEGDRRTHGRRHANAAVLTACPAAGGEPGAGRFARRKRRARAQLFLRHDGRRSAAADSGSLVVSSVKRGRTVRPADLRHARPSSTSNVLCASVIADSKVRLTSCWLFYIGVFSSQLSFAIYVNR